MKYATGGQSATEACLNHNFSSCAAITFHNGGISTLSRLDYGQARARAHMAAAWISLQPILYYLIFFFPKV